MIHYIKPSTLKLYLKNHGPNAKGELMIDVEQCVAIGACACAASPCLDAEKIVKKPCDKTSMERKALARHITGRRTTATRLIGHIIKQRIGHRGVDEEGEDR